MIPEAFTYERAGSVDEALAHMGRGAAAARRRASRCSR